MSATLLNPAAASGLRKVGTYTQSSASTTFLISNTLNLSITKKYFFIANIEKAALSSTIEFFVNNDKTSTNYYNESVDFAAAGVSAMNQNTAWITRCSATATHIQITGTLAFTPAGRPMVIAEGMSYSTGSDCNRALVSWTKNGTIASITQLDLVSSGGNISTNSTISIYEVIA
jgi:hypothetical protein